MGKWTGKIIIGLTGNIGSGKSVVRKMLEHLGAYGLDADALAHRAIARGAPGYKPVVEAFGNWVLAPDGEIDRARLGRLVFSYPEGLQRLEAIVHPLVDQAVDVLVRRATQPVIVIEAIKLLESNLARNCDSIWVTVVSPEIQLQRLVKQRGMSEADARQRIEAQQASLAIKTAAAQVLIRNDGSFTETWLQVSAAWQKLVPAASVVVEPAKPTTPLGTLTVERARPRNVVEMAAFLNRYRKGGRALTSDDLMAMFGEKAFLLLRSGTAVVGVVGWQVENLVSRTLDLIIAPEIAAERALPLLLTEMEKASRDLQSEASLVFVSPELSKLASVWSSMGYEQRTPQTLGVRAWQEAAEDSKPQTAAVLFFKQLRQDRVLRPI